MKSWHWPLALLALLPLVAGACGGDGATDGEVRVFAASSLTDAFSEAATAFEAGHPGTQVVMNFGSSSTLATQIREGAPAGVFASANTSQMAILEKDGLVTAPRVFATNSLVVVATKESAIESFRDLARPGLRLVLAGKDVPAGQYARESLQKASTGDGYGAGFSSNVLANLKSDEVNVRAALAKVELGEADAAIVYGTDARVAPGVRVVPIPGAYNVVAEYPLAALKKAVNADEAGKFVAFLLSDEGQRILARHGFGPAR